MILWHWFWWTIPIKYIKTYFIMLSLIMFILPFYFFGFYYTTLGFLINFVWYDIVFYGWVKVRESIERDLEE